MKFTAIASVTLATALVTNAYALQITKPVASKMPVTDSALIAANNNQPLMKDVYLMGIKLSAKDLKLIKARPNFVAASHSSLPPSAQVGMNNTPVLDQGNHGSCVTFAITAAYDALIGKGDYISQLCSLELGKSLEDHGYLWSGWDGSWGNIVLAQFDTFGLINKSHEKDRICGGLSSYPVSSGGTGSAISEADYKKASENLHDEDSSDKYSFEPIITSAQSEDPSYKWDSNTILNTIKQELATSASNNGDRRIAFGVLILYGQGCMTGACGTYHNHFDTWTLTEEMKKNPWVLGGHEMVITGYDDNAVAVDPDGTKHQGLLTLRNSWGTSVGDKGDFYMSYDFFTKNMMEAHIVMKQTA